MHTASVIKPTVLDIDDIRSAGAVLDAGGPLLPQEQEQEAPQHEYRYRLDKRKE